MAPNIIAVLLIIIYKFILTCTYVIFCVLFLQRVVFLKPNNLEKLFSYEQGS